MNTVNLVGRLTKAPEVSKTQTGISVCRFSMAVKRRFKVNNETVTDFFNVVAWRETAEYVGRYFSKGQKIGVVGSLKPEERKTKSGDKYITYIVEADSVEACGPGALNKETAEQVDQSEQATAEERVQRDLNVIDDEDFPF